MIVIMLLSINDKDIKKYQKDLKKLSKKILPFVTRATINGAAFRTQTISRAKIGRDMILRNKWTEQSIRVTMARTLNIARQEAVVGSVVKYMRDQEFGITILKKGKVGHPIPTSVASGEGEGAVPRRKLPTRVHKLRNIRLSRDRAKVKHFSKKQAIFLLVKQAVEDKKKFVYLDTGRSKAIYRVRGNIRRLKSGRISNTIKMKMVYSLSKSSVNIPRTPWLSPSFQAATFEMPGDYRKNLKEQLKKLWAR